MTAIWNVRGAKLAQIIPTAPVGRDAARSSIIRP